MNVLVCIYKVCFFIQPQAHATLLACKHIWANGSPQFIKHLCYTNEKAIKIDVMLFDMERVGTCSGNFKKRKFYSESLRSHY